MGKKKPNTMSNITVELKQRKIQVNMSSGTSWNAISGKPTPVAENSFMVSGPSPFAWIVKTLAQVKTILGLGSAAYTESSAYAASAHTQSQTTITADAFQTPAFANPLALDATSHKDFKCGTITGDTTINMAGCVDGDAGMIELIIDGTGGYTVALGTMFTKKLSSTSIVTTAAADNFISWRMVGTDIVYTIIQKV